MAERKEEVMEMVREELDENPDAETQALYDKAVKVDSAIKDLSLRQFHARYPLQVKRRRSAKKTKRKKKPARKAATAGKKATTDGDDARRAAIRDGLLTFAKDVAGADDKAELISVLTSVDGYVDKVLKKIGG